MIIKQISSAQNPLIKHIQLLTEKARVRKETGTFVIEGIKEISLALQSGYKISKLLFNASKTDFKDIQNLVQNSVNEIETIELTNDIYSKIAYRESTENIIAIADVKNHALENIRLPEKNPFILIAEAPEKPGNIGALLRTSDAAGVDAVIIADPKTDLYNPNVIRSGIGTLFTNQVITVSSEEVVKFLKMNKITIFTAELNASLPYYNCDFKGPCAIVVGTESTGVTQIWLENSDQNVIIPMHGRIDSMNVSVSAAILLFEVVRQRTQI
ncbi:MAG: RNA methyltransferase [Saprospiraceae bacterium]|nr:RNA methyltransferase [Saprospiraceae bacterium]